MLSLWPFSDYACYLSKAPFHVVGTVTRNQKSCCGVVSLVEIHPLDSPFHLKSVDSAEGLADSTARCVSFSTSNAVRIKIYILELETFRSRLLGNLGHA